MRVWTWRVFFTSLVSMVLVACSREADQAPGNASLGDSKGIVATDGMDLASLREEYQDVIAAFPVHCQSETVLDALCAAAQREGLIAGTSPRLAAMKAFPDENIGLYCFELAFEERLKESHERALEFCEEVSRELPASALGAISLDKQLGLIREDEAARFLELCSSTIDSAANGRCRAAALLRRAEYLYMRGELRPAALDYLRMWAEFPKTVEATGLSMTIRSRLEYAGLYWEAAALKTAASKEDTARSFLDEFCSLKPDESGATEGPESLTAVYWKSTPDLECILSTVELPEEGSMEALEFLARAGCLAIHEADRPTATALYDDHNRMFRACLSASEGNMEEQLKLARHHGVVSRDVMRLFSNLEMNEMEYRFASIEESECAVAFSALGVELAQNIALQDEGRIADAFAAMDSHVDIIMKAAYDGKAIKATYLRGVELFPESPFAPKYTMKAADHCREVWRRPDQAAGVYEEFLATYPGSSRTQEAKVKLGLCLHETKRFEKAYHVFEEALSNPTEARYEAVATLVMSLCEAELGCRDRARAHMKDVAKRFPESPCAPRALFWLGCNFLSDREGDKARAYFQDLMARYPESEYAAKGRSYCERLDQLREAPGQSSAQDSGA